MKQYQYTALCAGVVTFKGSLEDVIMFIREAEAYLDRSKEHSPWTVGIA